MVTEGWIRKAEKVEGHIVQGERTGEECVIAVLSDPSGETLLQTPFGRDEENRPVWKEPFEGTCQSRFFVHAWGGPPRTTH